MKQSGRRFRALVLPPLAAAVIVLAALETYTRAAHLRPYIAAPPSAVARALFNDDSELYSALGWTALASFAGFAISALAGVSMAIVMSALPLVRRAIYPYTILFQTVPIIAIAPALVIWIGYGLQSVIVCVVVVSIFPVIVNALNGMVSTEPSLVDLFRLYGAGPIASIWKLRLPSALPTIFNGLRVAAGLAVIGAVVSEIMVGETVGHAGLGVRIKSAAVHDIHLDRAFAAILLASGLGLALFGLVNFAAWISLRRWHASQT